MISLFSERSLNMRMEEEAAAIRAAVGALVGRRGRGNPYPEGLRRRAVEYFRTRRKQRISPTKICLELGMGIATLRSWTSPKRARVEMASAGFERLEVINASSSLTTARFVVRGPAGLCIEGLDIDTLAELIRRLS
jgi:hypothetical protein